MNPVKPLKPIKPVKLGKSRLAKPAKSPKPKEVIELRNKTTVEAIPWHANSKKCIKPPAYNPVARRPSYNGEKLVLIDPSSRKQLSHFHRSTTDTANSKLSTSMSLQDGSQPNQWYPKQNHSHLVSYDTTVNISFAFAHRKRLQHRHGSKGDVSRTDEEYLFSRHNDSSESDEHQQELSYNHERQQLSPKPLLLSQQQQQQHELQQQQCTQKEQLHRELHHQSKRKQDENRKKQSQNIKQRQKCLEWVYPSNKSILHEQNNNYILNDAQQQLRPEQHQCDHTTFALQREISKDFEKNNLFKNDDNLVVSEDQQSKEHLHQEGQQHQHHKQKTHHEKHRQQQQQRLQQQQHQQQQELQHQQKQNNKRVIGASHLRSHRVENVTHDQHGKHQHKPHHSQYLRQHFLQAEQQLQSRRRHHQMLYIQEYQQQQRLKNHRESSRSTEKLHLYLHNDSSITRARIHEKKQPQQTLSKSIHNHRDLAIKLVQQALLTRDFVMLRYILRMSPHLKRYFYLKDEHGNNILHKSCLEGDFELVTILIECGLDINVLGSNGRTPLHFAVLCSSDIRVNMIKFLLNSSAEVNVRDNDDQRPVDLCNDQGIKVLLLKKMNKRNRSFSTIRRRSLRRKNIDTKLERVDSGIMSDDDSIFFGNWSLSFQDFKLCRETVL